MNLPRILSDILYSYKVIRNSQIDKVVAYSDSYVYWLKGGTVSRYYTFKGIYIEGVFSHLEEGMSVSGDVLYQKVGNRVSFFSKRYASYILRLDIPLLSKVHDALKSSERVSPLYIVSRSVNGYTDMPVSYSIFDHAVLHMRSTVQSLVRCVDASSILLNPGVYVFTDFMMKCTHTHDSVEVHVQYNHMYPCVEIIRIDTL